MRRIIAVAVMCLLVRDVLVFAGEPQGGVLTAAAHREAARLALAKVDVAQPAGGSSGHPVLIGTIIGATVGGIAGYATASCSVPPPDDVAACGTRYKGVGAVLGAGLGAAVGALIGLAFRR